LAKFSVLIFRSPFKNVEVPDCADWLIETILKMKKDARIGDIYLDRRDDTPAYAVRNWAVERAKELKVDFLLMVDSDMKPDLPRAGMVPFWDCAFEFAITHNGPSILAAPYCGKAPFHNCFAFCWRNRMNPDKPMPYFSLEQINREEAFQLAGIQEVAAMPTGLILIDMRAFDYLEPPHFQYEWKDKTESERVSTEDVFFTRNASLAGIPVYATWSSWAGHWKEELVPPPQIMTVDMVRDQFKKAIAHGITNKDKLVEVGGCRKKDSFATRVAIDKTTLQHIADDNSGPTARIVIPGDEQTATDAAEKEAWRTAGEGHVLNPVAFTPDGTKLSGECAREYLRQQGARYVGDVADNGG
jgi:hypothetical protein